MPQLVASLTLIAIFLGCAWVVGHTGRDAPILLDGTILLVGIVCFIFGVFGLIGVAFS